MWLLCVAVMVCQVNLYDGDCNGDGTGGVDDADASDVQPLYIAAMLAGEW